MLCNCWQRQCFTWESLDRTHYPFIAPEQFNFILTMKICMNQDIDFSHWIFFASQQFSQILSSSNGFIVGGEIAKQGAYPFIAAVGVKNPKDPLNLENIYVCGGSLVSLLVSPLFRLRQCKTFSFLDFHLSRFLTHSNFRIQIWTTRNSEFS